MRQSQRNKIDKMNDKDMFVYYAECKKNIEVLQNNLDNEKEILNYLVAKMKNILDSDLDFKNTQEQDNKSNEKEFYEISEAPVMRIMNNMSEDRKEEVLQELLNENDLTKNDLNLENGLNSNV